MMLEKLKNLFRGETVDVLNHDSAGPVLSDVYDSVLTSRKISPSPQNLRQLSNVLRRKRLSYTDKRRVAAELVRHLAGE